ncbi:MAG: hypothetical protein RLZZ519_6 [Bacteroidota bacterium]|jgi:hypothetical protein
MKTRVLTESAYQADLLKIVFDMAGIENIQVIPRMGLTGAATAASSILASKDERVVLAMNGDQLRPNQSVEFVREYVGENSDRFRLVLWNPEIEKLFFVDKAALESALGIKIDDLVWNIAQTAPKSAINALLAESKKMDISKLLESKDLVLKMVANPGIQEIINFAQVAHA